MAYYQNGSVPRTRKAQQAYLERELEAFLAQRRESTGGYAPVEDEDLTHLGNILDVLTVLKWDPDPDGDRPLHYTLTDLKHEHRPHWLPIPHLSFSQGDYEDNGKMLDVLYALNTNLALAQNAIDNHIRTLQYHDSLRRKKEKASHD